MQKIVIKKDGQKEFFDEEKFCNNLLKLGLDKEETLKICKRLIDKLPDEIRSDELYKLTLKELQKLDLALATRYNLKQAIYRLGPTGYPFERYVGKILAHYGFETFINVWIDGKCLSYEIDVLAIKNGERYIIECKYHQKSGTKSDLKTALYVFGRYLDIKEKYPDLKPWLFTNTKITSEAIIFAECRNIKVTAWKYPKNESLENLIETKFLYPITVLTRGNPQIFKKLIEANVILLQDFLLYSIEEIAQKSGVRLEIIKKLKEEAEVLQSFCEKIISL